jgi:hypothetical protein
LFFDEIFVQNFHINNLPRYFFGQNGDLRDWHLVGGVCQVKHGPFRCLLGRKDWWTLLRGSLLSPVVPTHIQILVVKLIDIAQEVVQCSDFSCRAINTSADKVCFFSHFFAYPQLNLTLYFPAFQCFELNWT